MSLFKKKVILMLISATLFITCFSMVCAQDVNVTVHRLNTTYIRTLSTANAHMNANGTTSKATTYGYNDGSAQRYFTLQMREYNYPDDTISNSNDTTVVVQASKGVYREIPRDYDDMSFYYYHRVLTYYTANSSMLISSQIQDRFKLLAYQDY